MKDQQELEALRLIHIHGFFSDKESRDLLLSLIKECSFSQKEISLFGKKILQPRLIAYQGEPNAIYTYSNQTLKPDPWTPYIQSIKNKLLELTGIDFNSVLINYYRDGNDSMGMHSDNEPELGIDPVIASLSFGENREIVFKPRKGLNLQAFSLSQPSGFLLIMMGNTQKYWKHGISKSNTHKPRLNLTFRMVVS